MASGDLEEKINKIRLKNEEIRRRYEEVEADKKHAAKQNALVQMVPSDDWPERKEPPEFSAPPKNVQKQKSLNKEHNDRLPQHYSSIQDRLGKKDHKFTQGDGPPPDPKYNFLADSEREMRAGDDGRIDEEKNRSRNKSSRGGPRRRGGGGSGGGSREAFFKDNRGPQAFHSKEESLPEYEAWRAERNRIDEARINRQKTAEGNWRREWDSNKTNIEKDSSRKGDSNRKDSNMYERRNNHYDSDYSNRGHGGSRTYHGSQKNHGHQDYRRPHHEQSHEYKRQPDNKPPLSPTDDRTVTASDKSIKVTVNSANQPKGPVMSVKVNSPSIAGTGRVGPRQKSRITYSSQSDAEGTNQDYNNFSRQKSFDEKTAGVNYNSAPRSTPKSPFTQRKKEGNSKSPYPQKKEFRNDESSARSKNTTKSMYPQKTESKDQRHANNSASKPQRNQKRHQKVVGDRLENIAISNDNAVPSEYQPDISSNNTADVKVNISDNVENVSSLVNIKNQESSKETKSLDSSVVVEPTNEIVCNFGIENTNCESEENNVDIEKKYDHEETILNDDADKSNQSNRTEIEDSQNSCSNLIVKEKETEPQAISESSSETILDLSNSTQQIIHEDITVKQDSTLSAETVIDATVTKLADNVQKVEQTFSKEEILSLVSETVTEDITLTNNQVNNSEQTEYNNEKIGDQLELDYESQEAKIDNTYVKESVEQEENKLVMIEECAVKETNIEQESIKMDESKSVELIETSQDESINDSGLKDSSLINESIELNNIEITETSSSQNISVNDSGIMDDSIEEKNIQTVTPVETIIVPDAETNVEINITESMESNIVEPTKEICEKTADTCDISSAASSETSEVVKNYTETNDNNEEVRETLENPTKDSGVNVVDDINKIESSKITDLPKEILSEIENPETESTKVATE